MKYELLYLDLNFCIFFSNYRIGSIGWLDSLMILIEKNREDDKG